MSRNRVGRDEPERMYFSRGMYLVTRDGGPEGNPSESVTVPGSGYGEGDLPTLRLRVY
jgi:hypothetical protein